jgi:hypothetical protein
MTYRPLGPNVQEIPRAGRQLTKSVLVGLLDGRAEKKDSAQLLSSLRTCEPMAGRARAGRVIDA